MDSFAAEADTLEGVTATRHDREVAVTAVGPESDLSVDLRPVLEAAIRYGMVTFDGNAGATEATLHFKPAETVFDGDYNV